MDIKLLAIDTTESACSAALLAEGEIRSRSELAVRGHSERILPMMQSLLSEAGYSLSDLDTLAFGRGPGSFTGLRIAAGVIQGTALGADLPVVPVSTLRALAQGACRLYGATQVLSALDARMAEVYWGVYALGDNQLMQPLADELVCAPTCVPAIGKGEWYGAGSGWQAYPQILQEHTSAHLIKVLPDMRIDAQDIAHLAAADFIAGKSIDPEYAIPVYLRDNVAKKKAAQ
jgi:tRNA threonylcarbamoyladenosine biosynthesis protein TsaB